MNALSIHPTAVVSPEAVLGEGVQIGPYSVIGPQVRLGAGTQVMNHVVIDGDTQIGDRCRIFSGAALGGPAQTKKSDALQSALIIGHDNVIREFVTMNTSMSENGRTVVGDRNLFMAGSHVGHDCIVGSNNILANSVALGGHVQIEDHAVLGGLVGVHQFCRVGRLAMVGALSKVVMDIAPFSMAEGHRARFCGINAVGLKRTGYSSSRSMALKKALKMLLGSSASLSGSVPSVRAQFKGNEDVEYILNFIQNSERGVARSSAASSEK